jgi:hypothetical protein
MTAVCITEPWALFLVKYCKNVENNATNLKKRGTFAIYASSSKVQERFNACNELYQIKLYWEDVPKGAIKFWYFSCGTL